MIPFIFDVHLPNRTMVRSVRVLASDEPTARAKVQRMYPTGVLKTHQEPASETPPASLTKPISNEETHTKSGVENAY